MPDGEVVRGVLLNPGQVGCAIIEAEAEIIRECVKRVLSGEGQLDVVRDLNRRGIPTANGNQWWAGNLKALLLRKRYVQWENSTYGTRVHKGREYKAVWPYLITREDHQLMAAAFKMNGTGRRAGLVNGRTYLLSGIARCGRCGSAMYGNSRTISGKHQRRYVCRNQDAQGAYAGCGKVMRGADPVELLIKEAVIYRFDSPEVAAALAPTEDREQIQELVDRHGRQALHLTTLAADYGAGILSRDELVVAKTAAQAALDDTEAALAKLQTSKAVAQVPAGMTIRDAWDNNSLDWRRNLVVLLVDRITIEPGHPGTHLWNGWRFDPDKITITWRM